MMKFNYGDIFIATFKNSKRPVIVTEDKGTEVLVLLGARVMGHMPKNFKKLSFKVNQEEFVLSDTTAIFRKEDLKSKIGNLFSIKETDFMDTEIQEAMIH